MELRTDELDFKGRGRVCDLECCENEAVAWHAVCLERELASLRARLEAAEEELADWRASARKAANEECGDEKHCACVGLLKKTLRESFGHQIDMQSALEEAKCERGEVRLERDAALRELATTKDALTLARGDLERSEGYAEQAISWREQETKRADAANALLREDASLLRSVGGSICRGQAERIDAHLAASPSPLASPEGDGAGRECEDWRFFYEGQCDRAEDLQEKLRATNDAIQSDVAELLIACGLGNHARPDSCHGVIQNEILPRIREMSDAIAWVPTDTDARRAQGGDSNAEGSGA